VIWHEVLLGAVTVLFAWTETVTGWVVALNGVLCHGAMAVRSPWSGTLRAWDVACNLVMAVVANLHACGQPRVAVLTVSAFLIWRLNQRHAPGVKKATIHALGVQFPVLVALHHLEKNC
jgi:hypothetical protein